MSNYYYNRHNNYNNYINYNNYNNNNDNHTDNNTGDYLSIPKQWLNCPPTGDLIAGKFIPFKTPLDDRYASRLNVRQLFTPQMFISRSVNAFKSELGLWIDLTNTSRYYHKYLVEQNRIQYVKLSCKGHDESPTPQQTRQFIDICEKYVGNNRRKLICVHCTHGFNRTGFLICAYLIEKLNYKVNDALNAFKRCRPPGIYKQHCIDTLFERYSGVSGYNMTRVVSHSAPTPHWLARDSSSDNCGQNNNNQNVHRNHWLEDSLNGVTRVLSPFKCKSIVQKCQTLCNFRGDGFPGAQSVCLDSSNVFHLQNKEYMISGSTYGKRYMMLISGKNDIYLIDYECSVFKVNGLCFPRKKRFPPHLENTLIDGEIVTDIVNNAKVARYLIHDIISFESINTASHDFRARLSCIDNEIIGPRVQQVSDRTGEPFSVWRKDYWDLRDYFKIFDNLNNNVSRSVILKPVADAYIGGRCEFVLNWQPNATRIGSSDNNNHRQFVNGRSEKPFPHIGYRISFRPVNSVTKEFLIDFIQTKVLKKRKYIGSDTNSIGSLKPLPYKVMRKY